MNSNIIAFPGAGPESRKKAGSNHRPRSVKRKTAHEADASVMRAINADIELLKDREVKDPVRAAWNAACRKRFRELMAPKRNAGNIYTLPPVRSKKAKESDLCIMSRIHKAIETIESHSTREYLTAEWHSAALKLSAKGFGRMMRGLPPV